MNDIKRIQSIIKGLIDETESKMLNPEATQPELSRLRSYRDALMDALAVIEMAK